MTHRYVAVSILFASACMTDPDAAPSTAGKPHATLDDAAIQLIVSTAEASSCVEDGCPTGQVCDWIAGCTEQATFCCGDDQCGEGRHCDFEAGGLCKDD